MKSRSGYPELVLFGVIEGSIGVLVKTSDASASTIVFFRLFFGAAVVAGWLVVRRRLPELRLGAARGLMVAAGLVLAGHWAVFFEAYKRLDVATTILIVFFGPVLTALAAPLVLGEPLERRTLGALVLSVGGVTLIALRGGRVLDPAGLGFAVAAAVSFAAVVLIGKRLTEIYEPPTIVAWQLAIAAVALSPALLAASARDIVSSAPALVTVGVLHTGIAGILYFRGLTAVKAQHAGILMYLEPASAVLYAWVFLSETPGAATLLGGALILGAGMIVVLGARRPVVAAASLPEAQPERRRGGF